MGGKTSRHKRANKWFLRCPNCGQWKARGHFEPWTKTWLCQRPKEED